MARSGLRRAEYPGFDKALVERSWAYLSSCGTTHLYDSDQARAQCRTDYPDIDWEGEVLPVLCEGVQEALAMYPDFDGSVALPLVIRSASVGIKIPVDLRGSVDSDDERIGAVMALLDKDALPETIRFGDPSYLEAQRGKSYEEAIEALRRISEEKRRFFTCGEIDHHLFTHVFDQGDYRRSFQLIDL